MAAMDEKSKLIWSFYKEYPNNDEVANLMPQRWGSMLRKIEDVPVVLKEVDEVIATSTNDKVQIAGLYARANFTMYIDEDGTKAKGPVEAFIKKAPTDERSAGLLAQLAGNVKDKNEKLALYNRVLTDYPNYRGNKYLKGKLRQVNEMGKPFELSFTDAISGAKKTMADFKGKVVIIDYWATWCGPCVAELPKMKKLYAEMHPKGLEMISVSLDVPEDKGQGLTKLKDFVAKNDMPWSHYYQGNYWDSEFSTGWGINSIPCLFLIDQNGNLVDVEAREGIEEKVKKLLEKGA